MRKDWIRTEEERKLRQLQKLVKEEKKLNKSTNDQQIVINFPIVLRKKKRLMIKPIIPEIALKRVNTNHQIISIIFFYLSDLFSKIIWF
jgi:hypothetical protein